jgi:hypothetical protein
MPVEPDPQRQQSPLVVTLIAVVVAVLVFWGIWTFLKREHHPAQQPPQPSSKLQQHIFPTGGEVLDGVYRPSGDVRDWTPYPLTTLRRCTLSAPNAGTNTSSILRTSSKL